MSDPSAIRDALAHIEQLLAIGHLEPAAAACRELAQRAPQQAEPWVYLGLMALHAGRLPDAEAAFKQVIARESNNAGYWHNLSVALREQGKAAEAEPCARRALEIDPAHPALWLNFGNTLYNLSRWTEAAEAFRRSLAIDPNNASAWSNLGAAEERLQRPAAAAEAYERSLALVPDEAVALSNYAMLLTNRGQPQRAGELLQRLVQLQPQSAEAWFALGSASQLLGDVPQAEAAYGQALAIAPLHREARYNLAHVLMKRAPADAEACIRPLLTDGSTNGEAWSLFGAMRLVQCQQQEGLAAMRRAIEIDPHPDRHSMWLLAMSYAEDAAPGPLLAAHRDWDAAHARQITAAAAPPSVRRADRPLRLGFVSADFGQHPTGFLVLPALEHLDKSRCSVICYSDRWTDDELTPRFRAAADLWRPAAGLTQQELAEQIRRDEIDVLVDLMGHSGKRLLTFARRPAPMQISWFGYVGTTGMAAMDYLLADRFHVRPGEESGYCETVLRMPCGYACYGPLAGVSEIGPLPALAAGRVTFGSFNNPAKFSPGILAAWAEVLRRVPTARLLLKYDGLDQPSLQAWLREQFATRGIAPARILLEGRTEIRDHMAAYGRVDIALDTQPYSGGVTTCEALWMGVPVITCPGKTFASRHSQSHMTNAGYEQFVAADLAGYVALACDWANRLEELAALRAGLRQQLIRSPLCDAPTFAGDLLSLFQRAWKERTAAR